MVRPNEGISVFWVMGLKILGRVGAKCLKIFFPENLKKILVSLLN